MTANLVIAGCSRRKLVTAAPVPALTLYQGGCIPALRARLAGSPALTDRVWIMSARYGLVRAATPLACYDERLTLPAAKALQPAADATVAGLWSHGDAPAELLLLLEPLYLVPLAGLLARPDRPRLHWLPDPLADWPAATAILDAWGWP
jgi:hypothetical protein